VSKDETAATYAGHPQDLEMHAARVGVRADTKEGTVLYSRRTEWKDVRPGEEPDQKGGRGRRRGRGPDRVRYMVWWSGAVWSSTVHSSMEEDGTVCRV
jgi:hypothetical protein